MTESNSESDGDAVDRVVGETNALGENVHVRGIAIDRLRETFAAWDTLTDEQKYLAITREPAGAALLEDPDVEYHDHNVSTVGLSQTIATALEPEPPYPQITQLALGEDDTPAPTTTDTALANEADRVPITRIEAAGEDLIVATFISSTQANNITIRELGLVSDQNVLLNRSLIPAYQKTSTVGLIVEIDLYFEPTDS